MVKNYHGQLSASGLRFAIVASRFNELVVEPMVSGAIDAIRRTGGDEAAIGVYRCPGAFEMPQLASRVVVKGGIDALICIGAVIRGATPHFDYVAGSVTRGIAHLAERSDIPVTYGVITTDTIEQALERAGTKAGNKGFDAAMAAIEMATLFRGMNG